MPAADPKYDGYAIGLALFCAFTEYPRASFACTRAGSRPASAKLAVFSGFAAVRDSCAGTRIRSVNARANG